LLVLDTGCRWRDLPEQLGCGSGHTAWRRLREWQDAGVWDRLHQLHSGGAAAADLRRRTAARRRAGVATGAGRRLHRTGRPPESPAPPGTVPGAAQANPHAGPRCRETPVSVAAATTPADAPPPETPVRDALWVGFGAWLSRGV
jgi:hypothetical protein